LNDRISAWEKYHGREIGTVDNIDFMLFSVHLVEERQRIIDTIAAMPEKPALVIFDTYSNCTTGLEQNDQKDVHTALATAHEIKERFHCHVMATHHTNRTGTMNGSQAFKNHVDVMIELK